MTTVLSQKGQIALSGPIRDQFHLSPKDDFEVVVKEEDTITLRRISRPTNCGLVELLIDRPSSFTILHRDEEDSLPIEV